MSELIKHECGIGLVRLLQPLEYYQYKYGTWKYGLNKLYLLMEKQHNRGQDGAGVVCVNFDMPPGMEYISRHRSVEDAALSDVFRKINADFKKSGRKHPDRFKDSKWTKENLPFAGELYLGHLRYGTYGKNKLDNVHPVMRQNNWKSRNLVLAGNFNLTNVDELFRILIELGQHPKDQSDTVRTLRGHEHIVGVDEVDTQNIRIWRIAHEGFLDPKEMIMDGIPSTNGKDLCKCVAFGFRGLVEHRPLFAEHDAG